MDHYAILPKMLPSLVGERLQRGVLLWQKDLPGREPPLSIVLEPSRLAPMEGELQLRFSYRSELFVMTFLLASGELFGCDCATVLFVGGVQGLIGAREEMREASKLNGEISPAAMLVLAVQAVARGIGVGKIIGIGEHEHIATSYSPARIMFDYQRFWLGVGGERVGSFYRIPMETPHKSLSKIALTHRGRTKRKRAAKSLVTKEIEARVRQMIAPAALVPARASAPRRDIAASIMPQSAFL
jgi:uncharacterized protein VirK/YbjX